MGDKANEHRRNSVLKNKMKDNPLIEEFSQLKEIIQIWKSSTSSLNMNANYYKEKEYYKRLHYIRYADDILLGVIGTKKDCWRIIAQINKFLKKVKVRTKLKKMSY